MNLAQVDGNGVVVWAVEDDSVQWAIDAHGGTWYDVTGQAVGIGYSTPDNGNT